MPDTVDEPYLEENNADALSDDTDASQHSAGGDPPRKRLRTQASASTSHRNGTQACKMNLAKIGGTSSEAASQPDRDDRFYLPAGDCLILVENTLFKVHRFILSRDSSAFEHMFSVSDQFMMEEGIDGVDQPHTTLYGESVEKFRLLLSILYALPAEIAHFSTSDADVPTLLTIAEMTNKYSFATTASWAIESLHVVFKEGTLTNQWNPTLCRSSLFRRIIEVALLCDHQELCDFAVNKWIERIYNRTANPLIAMAVADKYGLTKLQGVSYYVALIESGPQFELNEDTFGPPEPEDELSKEDAQQPIGLTPSQKSRLLSGFFALVNLWDRLRLSAPVFQRPDGCTYHAHGCLGTWQHTWYTVARSDSTAALPLADVVGRLKAMQDALNSDGDITFSLTPGCRRAAMASLKELIKRVENELAQYFQDLTLPKATSEEPTAAD
ncbi:hypothetical protein BC835DRAFT_1383097 [Cytidiella melzeri]|nr:hypothetical protein BC835DRAFT_1383097 [Cytidiella melzeri]